MFHQLLLLLALNSSANVCKYMIMLQKLSIFHITDMCLLYHNYAYYTNTIAGVRGRVYIQGDNIIKNRDPV